MSRSSKSTGIFQNLSDIVRGQDSGDLSPHVPKGVRIYVIGDIHGEIDLLEELHEKMLVDAKNNPTDRVLQIFLGDYIDRGLESKGVVDWLMRSPPAGWQRVCLKGNHETMVHDFLEDSGTLKRWQRLGGSQTLRSYGVRLTDQKKKISPKLLREDFSQKLPNEHRDFYSNLPLFFEMGSYFFVHAGVHPDRALHEQEERDLIWIRDEFLQSKQDFGKIIVHGHTPVDKPKILRNRINIDTGAYMSGILTCLVLENNEQRFL
ncbi:MAG: metallophosphoesterase [Rhizobiaceae bacterium]